MTSASPAARRHSLSARSSLMPATKVALPSDWVAGVACAYQRRLVATGKLGRWFHWWLRNAWFFFIPNLGQGKAPL